LLLWGWGHVTLGYRRGWLFAILQVLALLDLLIVGVQLIDGTLWLVVFLPLVAIIVFWVAQAVSAYRRALALGGAPGGELTLAFFLPVVLAVFTGFWLVGGRHGSAAATVEAYMEAWESNRPDLALALMAGTDHGPTQLQDLTDFWANQRNLLTTRLADGQAVFGPNSGLDPARPFSSLRVTQTDATTFSVEIVRSETFQTTLLGFIQTSGQRTVVVAPLMWIVTAAEPASWILPSATWQIDHVGSLDSS
jgi:hypothetical protein